MTAPKLTSVERRALRARAHHLDPVVMIGNDGLTPAVLHEIDVNLLAHGLIKIRVFSDDRAAREELLVRIAGELDAAPIQHIGKLLVIFRPIAEAAPPARVAPARRPAAGRRRQDTAGQPAPRAHPRAPRGGVPRTPATASDADRKRRGGGSQARARQGGRAAPAQETRDSRSAPAQQRRDSRTAPVPRGREGGRAAPAPRGIAGRRRRPAP